ncbi:MAG: RNA-binding protein [Candidatus Muiribacterium halophilum]|uniref:RNA-binding protein n=1 Tax=Muiribacterium halophilum TaxID=2053465 RepID=A0A2N5ZHH5_MUIH1|nr:MAG: RNA-binding protein [Candidatus Muirbacterium halophilum]
MENTQEMEIQITKVYVGNLDYETTSNDLKDLFSKYGELVEVAKIPEKNYGFVKFSNQEKAVEAIKDLNNTKLNGRYIIVEKSDRSMGGHNKQKKRYQRNNRRR